QQETEYPRELRGPRERVGHLQQPETADRLLIPRPLPGLSRRFSVRRALVIAAAAVFVIALLARAMTYTVRFTETGVLTTFGKAGDEAIKKDPGLYFKWPDPIQSVTKYDTRTRFLQTQLE